MSDIVDLTKGIYRRVYAGALVGRRICAVSIGAEAWFWRINLVVDDFGNCTADAKLLVREAAGRREITSAQAAKWTKELIDVGLLETYTVKGEAFLHVVGFEELQPCGRNGRRIRRSPGPETTERGHNGGAVGNPGESRSVEGVPGAPSPKPIPIPRTIPSPSPTTSTTPNPTASTTPGPIVVRTQSGPGRAVHASEGGLRAGLPSMAELDRSIGRAILRKLRWAEGNEGHLHATTIERLCAEPGCDGARVWWLQSRLRTAEATDPAAFVIAGIKEAWDVPADVVKNYEAWRFERYGKAVQLAQSVERETLVGGAA